MATNVVSAVRTECAKAIKAGDTTELTPAKWADKAGFSGSAASPLRQFMARSNGNGCGRTSRYPAVTAEGMLELLDLADRYQAEKVEPKRQAVAKRIGSKLRPATAKGASQAKGQAKRTTRKAKTAA